MPQHEHCALPCRQRRQRLHECITQVDYCGQVAPAGSQVGRKVDLGMAGPPPLAVEGQVIERPPQVGRWVTVNPLPTPERPLELASCNRFSPASLLPASRTAVLSSALPRSARNTSSPANCSALLTRKAPFSPTSLTTTPGEQARLQSRQHPWNTRHAGYRQASNQVPVPVASQRG